ncbi:MBL fold metallo-hydrolase [Paracoccus sp. S-4012]|uniref:MBL fold metallo-hydrolase n=1 Tax=Paracoccus sp. S-4012 TaxID=2665648 RepID=UPI0012AF326B|nr:MBL fold metallo-hydrolase [Paracoccus sp. S-4012]MRX50885.1 MBL fold metallo-hydrolase [Paracoccus sp. S-4012]
MLRVLRANNPSPLTGPGTNTWLLGRRQIAVIDPGPDDPAHVAAILEAVRGAEVTAIVVTHAHLDHSAAVPALAAATGAPVMGFGAPTAGRSPVMARLAAEGLAGGGEGLDAGFTPDRRLADGDAIESGEWRLTALWTPGHFGGHLAFRWDRSLFVGDLVLGWATTLISPPDGDLTDYMRSLERLAGLSLDRFLPGHGNPIEDPAARLSFLAAHRRARTAELLAALRDGPADPATLARRIYDVAPEILPAATRNVFAHLVALEALGAVASEGPVSPTARFALAG